MENMEITQDTIIYYDKATGRVLSPEELREKWNMAVLNGGHTDITIVSSPAKNLIIEDGIVKDRVYQTVGDLLAQSAKQKAEMDAQTADFQSLLNSSEKAESSLTDIDNPDYIINILENAKLKSSMDDYAHIADSSIAVKDEPLPSYERMGQRKSIKYPSFTKGLVKIATVATILGVSLSLANVAAQNISSTNRYNSAVKYIEEQYEEDGRNFVNRNKHIIEGSFDSYGHPIYFIDNEAVAKDILAVPDEGYLGALYMAYEQMGNDRANGEYDNWDDTIGFIGSLVDETHPKAYLTTAGCKSFDEFLIKAGYVDEKSKEPSVEMFKTAGKQAVIDFANFLQEDNITVGGR